MSFFYDVNYLLCPYDIPYSKKGNIKVQYFYPKEKFWPNYKTLFNVLQLKQEWKQMIENELWNYRTKKFCLCVFQSVMFHGLFAMDIKHLRDQ